MTAEARNTMRQPVRENLAIARVTHETGFARSATEYLLLVAQGAIVEQGDPEHKTSDLSQPITWDLKRAVAH